MRRAFLLLIGFLSLSTVRATDEQTTLTLTLGILTDINSNPVADGSLLQIIASPDGTFSTPTTDSFLGFGSNNILLWSGGFSSVNTGIAGSTQQDVTINLTQNPVTNYAFVVRWYPSLTTSDTTPGATLYGEFGHPTDASWVIGANGASTPYSFLTQSADSSSPYPDSFGQASNTVSAVPEPSSYAILIGLFSLGMMLLHIWRRSRSASESA
jgi:hypothetical protein